VSGPYATLALVTDVDASSPTPSDAALALTADELLRLTGGRLIARSDRPVRGAAVDSRIVAAGELFVALPGERTDGHLHLDEAVERGAAALLVTRQPANPSAFGDVTIIRVTEALAALGAVAAGWRRRFDPLVVGVTGSIAKTSTKEAIAVVLGASRPTLKTEGNQNNEIGLPLTLLRLGPEHRAAVLEMGMYVSGEIADLAAMARPSIGVVTAVQPVHLSRIGTIEAVEQAKGELLEALPRDGTAVLNADDPIVTRMDARTVARVVRYGFSDTADVRATNVTSAGTAGMRFELRTPAGTRSATIPTLGRLSVHNATAGAAVGLAAGLDLETIAGALEVGWSAPHRVELVRLRGVTVIDDSYNASPGSVTAALDLLSDLPGRHVAVLGEMLELGDAHDSGHREVGEIAGGTADLLVVVGEYAGGIIEGALDGGIDPTRVHAAADAEAALDLLRPRLRDGDVVLVKASRGIGLDRLVDALRLEFGEAAR
jgi:UDP-N-acetylmuramoyl-tripeptide--D-alanyl-D-alanine ligase